MEKAKKVIPTPQEMAKILMAAGKERPFLLVLFHTLARVDEIQRLKWEDVNFTGEDRPALDGKRKGGVWEYDWLPMNEDLEEVLWGLWRKRTQDEWVFVSPWTGTRYVHRFTLIKEYLQESRGAPLHLPLYSTFCRELPL